LDLRILKDLRARFVQVRILKSLCKHQDAVHGWSQIDANAAWAEFLEKGKGDTLRWQEKSADAIEKKGVE